MSHWEFQKDVLPLKNQLYRIALRITQSREDAEDVVQETLIRLWNSISSEHTSPDNLEAFAVTVCRNLSLDLIDRRDLRRGVSIDAELHDRPSADVQADEKLMRRERTNGLLRLLNTLPEKQRTAMQLRDIEGYTYREIADIMQISESDVKVNIFRARRALKEKLISSESWITNT